MYGSHGAGGVRIIPEDEDEGLQAAGADDPPRRKGTTRTGSRPSSKGSKAGSDFSYGGPLTELAMLGVIAIKLHGTKLEWDGAKAEFTNCAEANQLLNPPYRQGWSL